MIPDHGMPPEEDELEPIPKRKPLTPSEEAALPVVTLESSTWTIKRPWEDEWPTTAETDD